eukprot:6201925-Pleurochrysis_carterae.AAC.9
MWHIPGIANIRVAALDTGQTILSCSESVSARTATSPCVPCWLLLHSEHAQRIDWHRLGHLLSAFTYWKHWNDFKLYA